MKVTVKVEDKNPKAFEDLLKRLNGGREAYVTTGIHEDAPNYPDGTKVQEVALWNEYGTKTIPERSFIRSSFTESEQDRNNWVNEAMNKLIDGKWTVRKALSAIGFKMSERMRNKVKSNVPPPYGSGKKGNSPDVVSARQDAKDREWPGMGKKTLQASKLLLNSIGFKVKA